MISSPINFWTKLLTKAIFLLPDLSTLGYLAGPRVGAVCYNSAHYRVLAVALGIAGWLLGQALPVLAGIVLLFHGAFDRLLGMASSYDIGFQDMHLGRVGANQAGQVAMN